MPKDISSLVDGVKVPSAIATWSAPAASNVITSSADALIEVSSSPSKSILPVPPIEILPWAFKSMSSTHSLFQALPDAPKSSALSVFGIKLPSTSTSPPPGSRWISAAAIIC